jgi:transcription elongation GreA/GreB family factor
MTRAALAARAAATHEESRAEDRHDTRGLEASYLAGAQAERAGQVQEALLYYERLTVRDFAPGEAVQVGALVAWVALGSQAGASRRVSWTLLLPEGAGTSVRVEGAGVQVVRPQSPLGQALLGLRVGDRFELETPRGEQECEVQAVQ